MICPRCQRENPEAKKFCCECGARLLLVCPQCGSECFAEDKFCGYCGQKLDLKVEIERTAPVIEGELKQVTVLFSDLSGYTAISERLDPEEVKELMNRIFGEIAQVVTKYEGFIDKFIGDAVLAFFGIPKAHEDDPIRAIRAAGEIHDLVEAMSPKLKERIGQPLTMHTGINTGLVVTGEADLGKGAYDVLGDTVNVASRLMNIAEAGRILVGANTYKQTEGYFAFDTLEPIRIKGKAEPVQVYEVLSARERPITIHRLSGLRADLIGRKVEMAQLLEAVEELRKGKGMIFSICGDAGTGKSRLIEELKSTLDFEGIQWQEGHAYAYCQNIPYFPLINMLNRAWQIEEGDPPEKVREKIESSIENLIGKREDVIPYIGSLYALNYPEVEGIDPEFWKTQLHKAIQEILSGLVQKAPTIIYLEDLHWADPSSLDFVRSSLSAFKYPALFLYAYRSYFSLFTSYQLAAFGKSYQEIRLQDLSPSEAQDMTESLLKTKTIPLELRQFIQERVEGNPFYLEEVINSLIESETLIRDNGGWRLNRSISESAISPTIHGVISGRLDRLEEKMKRILQEASVIGRAFLYDILKMITERKEHIDRCLIGLEQLDLIRTRSLQPELEYIFKHALTQEVVYNGLLKREREKIHERIGIVMEQLFHDRLSESYESLAFHFKQGLSILKAVDYLMKSGEKSLKRYAVEEAHQYYKEAFDLLSNKPDKSREEEELLIDLLFKWAYVFHYRGDYKWLSELLMTHKDLVESLDDKARLGMFYTWLGIVLFCRERFRESYQYLCSAIKLGEETGNQQIIGYSCSWLPWTCADLGFMEEGVAFGERGLEIAELLASDAWSSFWVYCQSLASLGYLYWHRGETKKTFDMGKTLLDHGQRHSNIRSLGYGHFMMGFGYFADGNFQLSIEHCKKGMQISQDPWYSQFSRILLGVMYIYHGQFQEGEDALQQVVTYSQNFGAEVIGTPAKTYLGVALIGNGHMGQGLKMIEEAQISFLESQRKGLYALSEHLLGKVYSQIAAKAVPITLSTMAKNIGFITRNVPFASKKAEGHFNKAIEAAREHGAKSILGTVYLDLGLLHKAKGRTDQARECMSQAIQLFEQCEAEVNLRQAQEAIASLK